MSVPLPAGVLPIVALTTGDILYGDRTTSYRWEILTHQADGTDKLLGYLDGVVTDSPQITWNLYRAVKGTGSLKIADLAQAKAGYLRIADVALPAARLRPVLIVDGLPEIPLGVFLFSAAPEAWSGSGRVYSVELLDRATVLDQDDVEVSYTVDTATPILTALAAVMASAGEAITVDATVTQTLANPKVWDAGTSKLQIANDLLDALNYNSLWIDGPGNFRATPYLVPAKRGVTYEVLNLPRELVDGDTGIYGEEWTRDRDLFKVPNKVIAVQSASGDKAALTGVWTNTDPTSPFSYVNRGNRWISSVLDGVEVPAGTDADIIAFLQAKAQASLISSSAVQATVEINHLPIPIRVGDVARFKNTPAGIDKRHAIVEISLDAHPLGLMKSKLQEVIDL